MGIVHRDLKPDNIFLHCQEGGECMVVKILDFGIRALRPGAAEATGDREKLATATGNARDALYMAPEQAKGEGGRRLGRVRMFGRSA